MTAIIALSIFALSMAVHKPMQTHYIPGSNTPNEKEAMQTHYIPGSNTPNEKEAVTTAPNSIPIAQQKVAGPQDDIAPKGPSSMPSTQAIAPARQLPEALANNSNGIIPSTQAIGFASQLPEGLANNSNGFTLSMKQAPVDRASQNSQLHSPAANEATYQHPTITQVVPSDTDN